MQLFLVLRKRPLTLSLNDLAAEKSACSFVVLVDVAASCLNWPSEPPRQGVYVALHSDYHLPRDHSEWRYCHFLRMSESIPGPCCAPRLPNQRLGALVWHRKGQIAPAENRLLQ